MSIKDFIKKYDTQNQFSVLQNTYKQISESWNNKIDLTSLKNKSFSSIVFCGLGGSAISGDLLCDYLSDELKLAFDVVRGYKLPSYVNKDTLVIISSYSGYTEETISCLEAALNKKSNIAVITSGGKIAQLAGKNNLPIINLKSGFQPRYALGQGFFSLLKLMQELGFVDENKNVKLILDLWQNRAEEYSSENNRALQIANELVGFIPVIYASEFFSSTAYRLKSQFNENSKLHAFQHSIPEMNHNEIIGWESYKEKQFSTKVIYLLDNEYHTQNLKRYEILKEMLTEKKVEVLTLKAITKIKRYELWI